MSQRSLGVMKNLNVRIERLHFPCSEPWVVRWIEEGEERNRYFQDEHHANYYKSVLERENENN